MTRHTSIEAYHKIKASGLLSKRKLQVYEYVYAFGPVTARDTWKAIAPNLSTGSIATRFSELLKMNVMMVVGEVFDAETGMTVLLWDVTSALPSRIKQKPKPCSWTICKAHLQFVPDDKEVCTQRQTGLFHCDLVRAKEIR